MVGQRGANQRTHGGGGTSGGRGEPPGEKGFKHRKGTGRLEREEEEKPKKA